MLLELAACVLAGRVLAEGTMSWMRERIVIVLCTAVGAALGVSFADDVEAAWRGALSVWLVASFWALACLPRIARHLRAARRSPPPSAWSVVRDSVRGFEWAFGWSSSLWLAPAFGQAFGSGAALAAGLVLVVGPFVPYLQRETWKARRDDLIELAPLTIGLLLWLWSRVVVLE